MCTQAPPLPDKSQILRPCLCHLLTTRDAIYCPPLRPGIYMADDRFSYSIPPRLFFLLVADYAQVTVRNVHDRDRFLDRGRSWGTGGRNRKRYSEYGNWKPPCSTGFGKLGAHMDCEARAVLKSVSGGPSEDWPSTSVLGTKRESDKKEKI